MRHGFDLCRLLEGHQIADCWRHACKVNLHHQHQQPGPLGKVFLSGWFRSGIVKKSGRGRFGSVRIPSGFPCTLFMIEYLWLFWVFLDDVRVCPIFRVTKYPMIFKTGLDQVRNRKVCQVVGEWYPLGPACSISSSSTLLSIDIAKDSHNLSNKRPSLILKVMCSLQPTDARRCN